MTAPTIEAPRSPSRPARRGVNWEKWGWIYMRASGVVLIVLIFGHLFVNLLVGDGVHAIDFGFVGGKLSQPFWQWWDVAMLWLALIHGGNGMRTLVNDYATNPLNRRIFLGAIGAAIVQAARLTRCRSRAHHRCSHGRRKGARSAPGTASS